MCKISNLLILIIVMSIFRDFDSAQSPKINYAKSIKINFNHVEDTTYEYSIKVIKKWEQYSATRYKLFGDEYIGYGHLLYKSDTITYLSFHQSDSLVRSDFNLAIEWVNQYLDTLPLNQKHVIAMLAFNAKRVKLPKSTLFKIIRQKEPYQVIQEQYYKYVYAGTRYLPKMKFRRMDEFKIW